MGSRNPCPQMMDHRRTSSESPHQPSDANLDNVRGTRPMDHHRLSSGSPPTIAGTASSTIRRKSGQRPGDASGAPLTIVCITACDLPGHQLSPESPLALANPGTVSRSSELDPLGVPESMSTNDGSPPNIAATASSTIGANPDTSGGPVRWITTDHRLDQQTPGRCPGLRNWTPLGSRNPCANNGADCE